MVNPQFQVCVDGVGTIPVLGPPTPQRGGWEGVKNLPHIGPSIPEGRLEISEGLDGQLRVSHRVRDVLVPEEILHLAQVYPGLVDESVARSMAQLVRMHAEGQLRHLAQPRHDAPHRGSIQRPSTIATEHTAVVLGPFTLELP